MYNKKARSFVCRKERNFPKFSVTYCTSGSRRLILLTARRVPDVMFFLLARRFPDMQWLELYVWFPRSRHFHKINSHPIVDDGDIFGTEMICRIISNMKRGKAPGIDGLSVEHLSYSHPALPVVISKLFKLIFACGYVPSGFNQSYIVPIPKVRDCRIKALTYDDFRG